jgi:hypothetical protein
MNISARMVPRAFATRSDATIEGFSPPFLLTRLVGTLDEQ